MLPLKQQEWLKQFDLSFAMTQYFNRYRSFRDMWNNTDEPSFLLKVYENFKLITILEYLLISCNCMVEWANNLKSSDNSDILTNKEEGAIVMLQNYINISNKQYLDECAEYYAKERKHFDRLSIKWQISRDLKQLLQSLYCLSLGGNVQRATYTIIIRDTENCTSSALVTNQIKKVLPYPFPTEAELLDLDNNTKDVWNDILEDI